MTKAKCVAINHEAGARKGLEGVVPRSALSALTTPDHPGQEPEDLRHKQEGAPKNAQGELDGQGKKRLGMISIGISPEP